MFRTTPTEPVKFIFDESLVEESAGKLLPNQLTVDNLTVEWLRNKLSELETSIKENQEKRSNLDSFPNGKSPDVGNNRCAIRGIPLTFNNCSSCNFQVTKHRNNKKRNQ